MDIILIIAVVAGLVIKSQGKKANDKSQEQMGTVIACVSAAILIICWAYNGYYAATHLNDTKQF